MFETIYLVRTKKQNKEVETLKKEIEKLKAEPDSESTEESEK